MNAHRMFLAMPSRTTARRRGLNRNHHVRVWCSCMDDPQNTPGTWSERAPSVVAADPRRLGSFDSLGTVDVRVADSAVTLWREHVEASAA